MDEIDVLLGRFERELTYFERTRDDLTPIMEALLPAVQKALSAPADADSRAAARVARGRYVERLNELRPLIDEWLRIRGSGERLWEATHAMSDEQSARFDQLCARELSLAMTREYFDELQARVRPLLLVFEESDTGTAGR